MIKRDKEKAMLSALNDALKIVEVGIGKATSGIFSTYGSYIHNFKDEFRANLLYHSSIDFEIYLNQLRRGIEDARSEINEMDEYCKAAGYNEKDVQRSLRAKNGLIDLVLEFINEEIAITAVNEENVDIKPEQNMKGRHLYILLKELGIIEMLESRLLNGGMFNDRGDRGFRPTVIKLLSEVVQDDTLVKQVYADYRKEEKKEGESQKAIKKVREILAKYDIKLEKFKIIEKD